MQKGDTSKQYNIVILHGWMQNKELWQRQADMLRNIEKINEVYLLDLPGFGEQAPLHIGADVVDYKNWVLKFIVDSKLSSVILLGHSFGGRITAEIAKDNPDWLEAVILYGAPCIYRPLLSLRLKLSINQFIGKLLPLKLKAKLLKKFISGTDLNGVIGTTMESTFRKTIVFDQTEQLKMINKKTYIVVGEKDQEVVQSERVEMHSLIKNSELILLPNVGHNIHIESPNLFYGTIAKIIKNI
jgi:pimeloyl-ACP methyl ester carboxylesterase